MKSESDILVPSTSVGLTRNFGYVKLSEMIGVIFKNDPFE